MPERNPVSRAATALLLGLVKAYSLVISPVLGPKCRFHPTCSAYARQALKTHGPLKGLFLTTGRVCSCHPWSNRPGIDPVPDQFEWRALLRYKREHSDTKK